MSYNPLARLSRFDPEEDLRDKTPLLNLALEKDPALSRFLVEIQFEGRWKKCEWNPEKELKLNHPLTHVLECAARTIYVRDVKTGERRMYPHLAVLTGAEHKVSPALVLRLRVFLHTKPAYVGSEKRSPDDILFASAGRLDQIIEQVPVGKSFTGQIEELNHFTVQELPTELVITPMAAGLVIENVKGPTLALVVGTPARISKKTLDDITLRKENYWWRFNLRIPTPWS